MTVLFSILFLLGSVAIQADAASAPSPQDKEKAALAASNEWLKLIDTGDFIKSWKETSCIFQTAVTQDKWTQIMKNGREPFGALVSRKFRGSKYLTELPGAPKGDYIVVQFETLLQNRKSIVVETVTSMLDTDKKWKVSGYYIK